MIEKIAFIGAGNMGGALVRGLVATGRVKAKNIWVSDPSNNQLSYLSKNCRGLNVTNDNSEAAKNADLVIIAVKPWLVETVLEELAQLLNPEQILASIAAGVDLSQLRKLLQYGPAAEIPIFRMIPNTAVAIGQGMTFMTSEMASDAQISEMESIFSALGKIAIGDERLLEAGMAVASCGIAYAMRYARAAMEGAIQIGLTPATALATVLQTMKGATMLLEATGEHPEAAIDHVTTAGGVTIRGLNAMEEAGFTNSVIKGLLASK